MDWLVYRLYLLCVQQMYTCVNIKKEEFESNSIIKIGYFQPLYSINVQHLKQTNHNLCAGTKWILIASPILLSLQKR
jgi:hypothetical protein